MCLRSICLLLIPISLLQVSCDSDRTRSRGAIVLGDPATIVTETDSQYLRDMVMDIQFAKRVEAPKDSIVQPPADTPKPAQAIVSNTAPAEPEEKKQDEEKGLKISLKEFSLLIPGVTARGSGTTYQLKNGSLNGKQIKISGGNIQKVSQRYQTVVVAKNSLGTLVLDNLITTAGWQALKGSKGTYIISGLTGRLNAPKVTSAAIRNAVSRAARKKRFSKKTEQRWISSVRNVRSANQKPLSVELRSVMWKIDGKDAKGKPFSKQVRIDLPI